MSRYDPKYTKDDEFRGFYEPVEELSDDDDDDGFLKYEHVLTNPHKYRKSKFPSSDRLGTTKSSSPTSLSPKSRGKIAPKSKPTSLTVSGRPGTIAPKTHGRPGAPKPVSDFSRRYLVCNICGNKVPMPRPNSIGRTGDAPKTVAVPRVTYTACKSRGSIRHRSTPHSIGRSGDAFKTVAVPSATPALNNSTFKEDKENSSK